jgi:hypothetical protein
MLGELPSVQSQKRASSVPLVGELYRGEHKEWASKFAISAPDSRHKQLIELVCAVFLQASQKVARQNAERQYEEASPAPASSLAEHLEEFAEMWASYERRWIASLSEAERAKFDALDTETERDAFRILRNWSQTSTPHFFAHCQNLADRLGITREGAGSLRRRFCVRGIMRKTEDYVIRQRATRYKWTAADDLSECKPSLICQPRSNGAATQVMSASVAPPPVTK